MALPNQDNSPSLDYKQAEMMINESIAKMGNETHIEYNTSINRDDKKTNKLKICRLLQRLISNR